MFEEVREYEGLKTSNDAGFPPTLLPASPAKSNPMFKMQWKSEKVNTNK